MADQEQENSREPLTKREREVIQELAKEIVREAGLAQAPEEQRRLEFNKMDFERAKSQMFVLSGVLVASVAVGSILPPRGIEHLWLLVVALIAAVLSYGSSYSEMFLVMGRLRTPGEGHPPRFRRRAHAIEALSFSSYVLAVPLVLMWVVLQPL